MNAYVSVQTEITFNVGSKIESVQWWTEGLVYFTTQISLQIKVGFEQFMGSVLSKLSLSIKLLGTGPYSVHDDCISLNVIALP